MAFRLREAISPNFAAQLLEYLWLCGTALLAPTLLINFCTQLILFALPPLGRVGSATRPIDIPCTSCSPRPHGLGRLLRSPAVREGADVAVPLRAPRRAFFVKVLRSIAID